MTLPYLPDDCIYNILQNLQSERSTLFNCLLVNRFWCKSTIPLLYANPFVNITGKNYAIILTLILCFDKEEILQLKKLLKQNQININIDEEHKPLFEYLKYLKNYNYLVINSAIERCFIGAITQYRIKYYSNYTIPIFPIFHQSILRHSINVKQLDISSNIFYNKGFKNLDIQNFTSNLTKLNILSLKFHLNDNLNEIEQEFLGNIANVCLNLKKLIIQVHGQRTIFNNLSNTNTNNMEKLCTIIQKQNKLKYFKITSWHLLLNNILLSLEFQKHSLVQIEFIDTDFNNNVDQCEGLNFASLKGLSLKRNIWNNDVTSLMIKYLEFLNIVLNYIERSNNSLEILGMQKLDKELNDEESKLLNQIKDKGVKIVEFNIYNDNRFDICDDYKDV
uniref:F-box domain-containing protein n=1 Tax=Rhizophagus irregularis (strain DAOM 181602 / DAOM 197198 / MUCL 43194) TaxID=747089 RepID=U9TJ94_RHIID